MENNYGKVIHAFFITLVVIFFGWFNGFVIVWTDRSGDPPGSISPKVNDPDIVPDKKPHKKVDIYQDIEEERPQYSFLYSHTTTHDI